MERRKDLGGRPGRHSQKKDATLIFGKHTVLEALNANKPIERIFIQKGLKGATTDEIKQKARDLKVPISLVPIDKLNRISRKNHQGVVAYLSLLEYSSLHHIISATFEQGRDPLVLVLDGITDVRNLGSIARSAECAGIDALVLPMKGSAQINSDAMKTSAGALNHLQVCREDNLYESCRYLQSCGLTIMACTEKGDREHYSADLDRPIAFIMGSEETGISAQLMKIVDEKVVIPLKGKIESLNVANAASVILFEACRQRMRS